jgi:hypothetical protein
MTAIANAAGGEPALHRRTLPLFEARRACLAFGVGLIATHVCSAQNRASPAAVKAAYLAKFLNYVELPATTLGQPDSPIVIGVAGADDVLADLAQAVRDRNLGARPLQARQIADVDSLTGVHLLFIGSGIDLLHSPLARAARERRLPFVTDNPAGLKAGACINFVAVDNRVRFEISLDAAEYSSIKISSRVLALAERVLGAH